MITSTIPDNFDSLSPDTHLYYMRMAYAEAERGLEKDEVPAGCVIVTMPEADSDMKILGKAHNMTESLKDPTAHAEILAITQAAAASGDWRILNSILYVTKEPCPMCGGAIVLARIPYVVWAVDDPKRGAQTVFSIFENMGVNHRPRFISGIMQEDCLSQLQGFFKKRRKDKINGME